MLHTSLLTVSLGIKEIKVKMKKILKKKKMDWLRTVVAPADWKLSIDHQVEHNAESTLLSCNSPMTFRSTKTLINFSLEPLVQHCLAEI